MSGIKFFSMLGLAALFGYEPSGTAGKMVRKDKPVQDTPKRGMFGRGAHVFPAVVGWRRVLVKAAGKNYWERAKYRYEAIMSKPRLPRMRRKLGPGRLRCLELMGCDLNMAFKDFVEG